MGERLGNGDLGEVVGSATAERPSARRQHDAADLGSGVDGGAEALVDGAMLGIDRDELGAGSCPQRLDHRAGGDQAFLVGQGKPLAARQRGDGDRQPGEPDDSIDDDIGVGDQVSELVRHGGERQRGRDLGAAPRIADGDAAGPELLGLGDQRVDRTEDPEGDDLEAAWLGADDIEGLRADRAGRPGDGYANSGQKNVTRV